MDHSARPSVFGSGASAVGAAGEGGPDPFEGRQFGRFRLGRSLGGAGAGRVYAATDTSTGAPVAIKLGRARRTSDGRLESGEEILARLRREADVLRRLDCAGIPRIKELGEQPPYLVLDRVDGVDLERSLKTRGEVFAGSDIAAICAGVAEILSAVHARGVLHADVKPSNIVLRDGNVPVLIDFGSARRLVAPDDDDVDKWSLTPGYAPPEFHRADAAVGPWSDIYSLGAVAYRMIAGRAPVPAEVRLRGASMASAAESAGPTISDELAALVDWAIELDPAARPFSAEEWRLAIRGIADDRGEDAATVRVRRRVQTEARAVGRSAGRVDARPRPSRVWRAAAALPVIAVAASMTLFGRDLYALYETRTKQEWIVDANGQGDETSIAAALTRARDGATIRVRPGTYRESLVISRPVELLGVVENGELPVIATTNDACVTVTAAVVRISQLVFRAGSGPDREDAACVDVAAGQTIVEGARISSVKGAGVVVRNGAELRLVETSVSGGGVLATGSARVTISGGEVREGGRSGIIARGGAELHVSGSRISGSREAGILLAEGAAARIENATIGESGTSAVEIRSGAHGAIADTVIERAGHAGIFVVDSGKAEIERTQVTKSGLSGLIVAAAGEVRVDGGTFEESREHGVLLLDTASGIVVNSRMVGNGGHGIAIERGGAAELTDNVVERNREPQILDARRLDGSAADRRRGGAS